MSKKEKTDEIAVMETAAEVSAEEKTAEKAESPNDVGGRNGTVFYASAGALVALLVIALFMAVTVLLFPKNVTAEAGSVPNYSYITENKFSAGIFRVVTDLSSIDTGTVGEKTVILRFFDFIDIKGRVTVVDTVAPQITWREQVIAADVTLSADMLAEHASDATELEYSMVGAETAAGSYKVSVSATDRGGNSASGEVMLTVIEPRVALVFELGTAGDEIASAFAELFGTEIDDDFSTADVCGKFTLTAEDDGVFYIAGIEIVDTTAPVAEVRSYDLPLGYTLMPEDIVGEISDRSQVSITIGEMPEFNTAGEYEIPVVLTDSAGNTSEYVSHIRVHDINTEITADVLSTCEDIEELIFNDEAAKEWLTISDDFMDDGITPGENTVVLHGEYSDIEVRVNGVDTVPPVLLLKDIYRAVGTEITPEELVLLCTDGSDVTYSFENMPDCNEEGTFAVTVSAVDSCGNKTVARAKVHYYHHRSMPVIHRLEDITVTIGEYPPYFRYVYATDDISSDISLTVNTDMVDFTSPGVYPITYVAVDEHGNETRESVLLTIEAKEYVKLDVRTILQNPALPNGCEVVSLAIALAYEGYEVDPGWLFDNYMPHSLYDFNADPWTTYIGNPRGYGLGCYAPCVISTGNSYLSDMGSSLSVRDVSGREFSEYEKYIDDGTPVIVWGLLYMNGSDHVHRAWEHDGEQMRWLSNSHCLVLIGYTNDTYIFSDPLRGEAEYSREAVEKSFLLNSSQACVIEEQEK